MSANDLDSIRQGVLDRMERGDRLVKGAIIAAAMVEGLLLIVAIFIADWSNPLHRLVFILSILTYSVVPAAWLRSLVTSRARWGEC